MRRCTDLGMNLDIPQIVIFLIYNFNIQDMSKNIDMTIMFLLSTYLAFGHLPSDTDTEHRDGDAMMDRIAEKTSTDSMDEEQLEISFRLDAEGRTTVPVQSACGGDSSKGIAYESGWFDYSTRAVFTEFLELNSDEKGPSSSSVSLHDELLFDCEIADCALMPRTFWVPADDSEFKPRCSLEQMARDIFLHHTTVDASSSENKGDRVCTQFDLLTSGAEWWVQIRPSPERTGRYALFGGTRNESKCGNDDDDDKSDTDGISFHWDKDEDLRLLCGGSVYVHPHLSTVTYLTSVGAPTLIVEGCRINSLTGEWLDLNEPMNDIADNGTLKQSTELKTECTTITSKASVFVSSPAKNKHLCFDGRYLHAAPSDLQERGVFAKQCRYFLVDSDSENKRQQRRHRRCTFLVNIWLNHKPYNVCPFPDSMIDKLSGWQPYSVEDTSKKSCTRRIKLSFDCVNYRQDETSNCDVENTTVYFDKEGRLDGLLNKHSVQQLTWPMGDSDSGEIISTMMPLSHVRSNALSGGNTRVTWQHPQGCIPDEHFGLSLEKKERTERSEPTIKKARLK